MCCFSWSSVNSTSNNLISIIVGINMSYSCEFLHGWALSAVRGLMPVFLVIHNHFWLQYRHQLKYFSKQCYVFTHRKMSGKCCIFLKSFHFFSQNGRIICPFWEKKNVKVLGRIQNVPETFSRFSQCMGGYC